MAITGAIFDMDGTLLDSMDAWYAVPSDYMRAMGMSPPADLNAAVLRMSLEEAADYMRALGVPGSADDIRIGMNALMDDFYKEKVAPKPGVIEMLRAFENRGVKMCVATASDREHVEAGLARAGIIGYIRRIFTCTEMSTTKHSPTIFHAAREYMGTDMASTWVFEDARHAAHTAKKAGYRVCGVFDSSEPDQQGLMSSADLYLKTFEGAEKILLEGEFA